MTLLIFQSFGVEETAVLAMLETIQEMKFFLRMAFGDSREFAGSAIEAKTQGLGQGNGASLAGWCVISIMILRAHGARGHGAHFIAPLSQVSSSLSAILYVDGTDRLHLDMDGNETVVEVHAALQRAIDNWGKLLIATGGTVKPDKCFFISSTSSGHDAVAGSMSDITKMRLQLCLFLCLTGRGRLFNTLQWMMLKRPSKLLHVHLGIAQAV